MLKSVKSQAEELLERGVVDAIVKENIKKRLERGEKLRLKLGIDPTGTDLHLGHMVVLRTLRRWQQYGHKPVIIIGDYTAQIGDPSGREKTRPPLSYLAVVKNAQDYLAQIYRVLDRDKAEVRWQTEWFSKFDLKKVIEVASKISVAKIMSHSTFRERLKKEQPFFMHESLYPLLQGYDSVAVKADIEFGGTDQKFNLLIGRDMQEAYNQKPQDIITAPLLIGTDGKEKMGKSLNNYVGIKESPKEMFGKLMSIPDHLIIQYLTLCTDVSAKEIAQLEKELAKGRVNPRDAKAILSQEIVTLYHSKKTATQAEKEFNRVFKKKEIPDEIPTFKLPKKPISIVDLLVKIKLAPSKSEAKRLVEQGAVNLDSSIVRDWGKVVEIKDGMILKVGKRRFIRLKT